MNAALLKTFGSPLSVEILPDPLPGAGEVVVDVVAAPGPIDRVLDLLPPLPDAMPAQAAAMTARPHGTVVLMGGIGVGLELPYRHLMRNCITVRGQWMYPREAAVRLIGLIRSGLLSLEHFDVAVFDLDHVKEAVAYAAAHGGPFQMTVIRP